MEYIKKKISVHRSLHDLFGRETTVIDLLIILIGSIFLTIAVYFLCLGIELSLIKKILLTFLALDIGGGVIANFSEGTNNYYQESLNRRYIFIAIHFLQPLILSWIFEDYFLKISSLTIYTLLSSSIITYINERTTQKTIASFLLLIGIILLHLFIDSPQVLQLILLIYLIKLLLSFSVNWTNQWK